ncbi:leucine-rich repeat-containing 72-like [Schistosoma japonicum]|uniref:Leucine-rich repeat-containing 72-like n=1 Tax=Schistosoma japonicum TaxID=6182 RepID=A0A4Z2D8J6_SCHJA|nr:leucine-rich repeat-containing 72-like [Schistosoma japonicum]
MVLLTDINLSNVQLKLIPNENVFSQLPYLQRLWLCNNQIETLNNCLRKCYSLIELRLNYNQLHSIHKQLYELHCLEILDLSLNHLSSLSEVNKELSRMHFLRELNLIGNPITQQSDFKFCLLNSHSTLTILNKQETLLDRSTLNKLKITNHHLKYTNDQSSKRKRSKLIQTKMYKNSIKSNENLNYQMETFEDNLKKHFQCKTITQFKCFDWSTISNSEMKRSHSNCVTPKNIVIQLQL